MSLKSVHWILIFFVMLEKYQAVDEGRFKMKSDEGSSSHHVIRITSQANNIHMNSRDYATQGFRSQKDRKYEEAIMYFTKAIDLEPITAEYIRCRAECYFDTGDFRKAQEDFKMVGNLILRNMNDQRALIAELFREEMFNECIQETLIMNNSDDLVSLGDKFTIVRRYDDAFCCYDLAINEWPSRALNYIHRARCYATLKDFSSAISDFREAMRLDPRDPNVSIMDAFNIEEYVPKVNNEFLSVLHVTELGKLCEELRLRRGPRVAISCHQETLEKYPEEVELYVQRGHTYEHMQHFDMAAQDFYTAIRLQPQNEVYRTNLRQSFIGMDRFSPSAVEILLTLPETELVMLATDLPTSKKFQNAIECYSILIEMNSKEAEYYRRRANCLSEVGDVHMAILDLQNIQRLEPLSRNDRLFLSHLLFKLGKYTEAIKEIQSVQQNGDEIADLGDRFFEIEKFQEAIWCYTEAIKLNPGNDSHYEKRGMCHAKTGNFDEVVNDLQEAIKLSLSVVSNKLDLVRVLARAKRFEDAEYALKKMLEEPLSESNRDGVLEVRQEVQEIVEEDRMDKLIDHLKHLIQEDSKNQIAEIMNDVYGSDGISANKINEVLKKEDKYLKSLTYVYKIFNKVRVFNELDTSMEEPQYFLDVITLDLMEEAVTAPSGISYGQLTIYKYLQIATIEPNTRKPLDIVDLRPNRALREAIRHWKEKHGRN